MESTTLPTIARYELEEIIRRIQLATEIEFTLGEEKDPFHPVVYFKIPAHKPFYPEINGRFNDKRYFQYASIKGRILDRSIGKALSEPTLVMLLGEEKLKNTHTQFANNAYGRGEHVDWEALLSSASDNPVIFKETANIGFLMAIHAVLMKASRIRLVDHSLDIRSYLEKTEALIREKHMTLYFHHHGWLKGMWFKFTLKHSALSVLGFKLRRSVLKWK